MGTVTNLNRFRKQQARKRRSQQAEQNRLNHGLTKAEREQRRKRQALEAQRLDGHRLGPGCASQPTESE